MIFHVGDTVLWEKTPDRQHVGVVDEIDGMEYHIDMGDECAWACEWQLHPLWTLNGLERAQIKLRKPQ